MASQRLDDVDYYTLLGTRRDATADDIKQAFHSFAKKYHPDRAAARHDDAGAWQLERTRSR